MCACRQKKSFFIEDILKDVSVKAYKNLSQEPTQPLTCSRSVKPVEVTDHATSERELVDPPADEKQNRYNAVRSVQKEVELSNVNAKVNLEQRRNTYPLYPTPIKANLPWPPYKDTVSYQIDARNLFSSSYFSDPVLNAEQLLRNQLGTNNFVPHPYTIRQAYGLERVQPRFREPKHDNPCDNVPPSCCNPWWGIGGRRKGGQVRFSAAQTGALERRFNASKYLSPDERRSLAATLRLSDRQVKTWFQNRRAKWRRSTPDSADPGSPLSADDASDDDVQIADDE